MAGRLAAAVTFATHFREHIMPRLCNLAKAEAVCVAAEVETLSGAVDAVWGYARKHGAIYLPNGLIDELHDWILTRVADEIEKAEAGRGR